MNNNRKEFTSNLLSALNWSKKIQWLDEQAEDCKSYLKYFDEQIKNGDMKLSYDYGLYNKAIIDLEIIKAIKDDIDKLEQDKPGMMPLPMSAISADYKEPLLTYDELEYLKAVIKPFRKEVEFITKYKVVHAEDDSETNFEYLQIMLLQERVQLPMFKKDTMYKKMELGKDYTLEELGIKYYE